MTRISLAFVLSSCAAFLPAFDSRALADEVDDLRDRVKSLETELDQTREALDEALGSLQVGGLTDARAAALDDAIAALRAGDDAARPGGIRFGGLRIGGAMRVNYVFGDYESTGPGPDRGSDGGNVSLDTFRINLDYTHPSDERITAKAEYRWYDGYNFLHTGWGGYQIDSDRQVQVGLTRVPFGVGPYGPSHSWFFDQHYYIGLADDMDLGVKLTTRSGAWSVDGALFARAEPNFQGDSSESARYSYDVIDNGSSHSHYQERGQLNLRVIRRLEAGDGVTFDLGGSAQLSRFDADRKFADNTLGYALALHGKTEWKKWELLTQVTVYDYRPDYDDDAGLSNDLVAMGAYDFAFPVASQGVLPSAALAYTIEPDIDWIDTITFYENFSVILKDGEDEFGRDLKDSALNVLGCSIARGPWFIYVDWAFSNGNYFVGDKSFTNFGANRDQDWQSRVNMNIGIYF